MDDDTEYKGSVTFCYTTALLHLKHTHRNKGLDDAALRNDNKKLQINLSIIRKTNLIIIIKK